MAPPRRIVPVPVFRWFAFASFLSMILIVLSGAAVRLTGSGLGCPDWPTCFKGRITSPWGIHHFIEYGNRMITALLFIVVAITFVAAIMRRPQRRDLIVLTGILIGGIVIDAALGAFVVYSKLNPWLVSLHLLFSLAMVVVGAVLYHRSKYIYGPGARCDVRDPHFERIARLLWVPFVILVITGTATTGSGPHSGASQGQLVAKRLPFAFSNAAWIHSATALLFIGLIVGLLLAVWQTDAPKALQRGVRALVELHVAGAVSLTIGVTQFHLRQSAHDREPGTKKVSA